MQSLSLRLVHLWERRDTPEAKQLFRYTMVSVISTAVSFAVLLIVYGVFRAFSEVWSTVFANAVATVPSYYLNRSWVWGKNGRSHLTKEILPFWTMSALGIVVSVGGASLAAHVGKTYHLHHLGQTVIVLAANVLSFAIFWVLKFIVFNRLFRVGHPVEELDELVESI
ncbi:MAG TPA: GtrA family protein [Acidimicrobiales bacterium]|nr:GtrA family protein [Acidimicrobiales bacterium]